MKSWEDLKIFEVKVSYLVPASSRESAENWLCNELTPMYNTIETREIINPLKRLFRFIKHLFKKKQLPEYRLKDVWELSKEDRQRWIEEEQQKWQDYYDSLL